MLFKPDAIYYEKEIENYPLGKELLEKYLEIPKFTIENHNNIPRNASSDKFKIS